MTRDIDHNCPVALRGPADADRFRVKYRGARYYIDPLEPCEILPEPPRDEKGQPARLPSFTAIKGLHKKEFRKKTDYGTFDLTALRAAKYVAAHAENLLRLDEGGIISAVASAPSRDLSQAGDRGTQVHSLLEAKLKGHDLDRKWVEIYSPLAVDYAEVIEEWWADQQPEAMYAEVVGLNWEHGYAFTSDVLGLRLRSFPGKVLAADWKTRGQDSNHGAYMEEGMQLAAAAFSEYIFVDRGDGQIVRYRPPSIDGGVIISIRPDSVEMYEVDLGVAWEAWQECCEGWRRRQSSASLGNKAVSSRPVFVQPAEVQPEAVQLELPSEEAPMEASGDAFAGLPDEDGTIQVDREAKAIHLRERILALSAEGKQVLGELWPKDVITFGAARKMAADGGSWWEHYTSDDLRCAEKVISAAERETGAPFPDDTNDGEPTVKYTSALVKALVERHLALPEIYRTTPPAGMVSDLAKVRQVEEWADAIASAEERLERSVEDYRCSNQSRVDGDASNGDVLKAGRSAAKALGLPAPRTHQNVRDDKWLWRAVS